MPKSMSVILSIGFLVLVILMVLRHSGAGKGGRRYAAQLLLTPNEVEFFHRLKRALPGNEILAQVSMGALLTPAVPRNSANYLRIRGTFAQKYVDFVICDPKTMAVVALVELDDVTHIAAKDAKRDAMLQEAGYRVLRWHSRNKPMENEIRLAVAGGVSCAT
jgi:hypothetical protein